MENIDYNNTEQLKKLTIKQLHDIFCELSVGTPFEIVAKGLTDNGLHTRKLPYLVYIANLTYHFEGYKADRLKKELAD